MRVLVIGTRFPRLPLRDGYVLHLHHLVAGLASEHEVHLVVGDDGDGPVKPIDGTTVSVLSGSITSIGDITEEVNRFRPDVVHAVGSMFRLGQVSNGIPARSILGALDAAHLNVGSRGGSLGSAVRGGFRRMRIRDRIRREYHKFGCVVVVSDEDRQAILHENPEVRCAVIPNGVDLGAFSPVPGVRREDDLLMFTGAMGYGPNVATAVFLAREVMPRIRARVPSAHLEIVGRDPSPEVIALEEIENIRVVGPVDDMAAELSRASIYLCPMVSGTGIKNKLLEAMAGGLPCVASPLATRGTAAIDGEHLLVADGPEEVADAALRLLAQPALRDSIGEGGIEYVTSHHTWTGMAASYTRVYEGLVTHGVS